MNAQDTSLAQAIHRTSGRVRAPVATAVLTLLLALTTASPAAAQNNDDDGVLPGARGSNVGGMGTGAPAVESHFSGVMLAEEPASVELDEGQSRVVIETEAMVVQPGTPDADVVPVDGQALQGQFEPEAGRLSLQSPVMIFMHAGMQASLRAASETQHRLSVLVLETGGPLELLLSGAAMPLIVDVRGDVPELDLRTFRDAVADYGQEHPGLFVTWVNGSIDLDGELHLMAVRASTDGGPLEIGTR